uniref:gluconokinase n=1 Tax=Seriola dumerili TaxID=41447 RepID=A0A3B4VM68_SERDU
MIYIVMGVSGCGKSSLGAFLSEKVTFYTHIPLQSCLYPHITSSSPVCVFPFISWAGLCMKGMTSTHRRTLRKWLGANRSQTRERCSGSDAVVVCSALKCLYRQILLYGSKALTFSSSPDQEILPPIAADVFFLFLHGDYDLIHQRMMSRRGHYMKADLLRSQFDVLEPPLEGENVLSLDIRRSITDMAMEVEKHIIGLKSSPVMP